MDFFLEKNKRACLFIRDIGVGPLQQGRGQKGIGLILWCSLISKLNFIENYHANKVEKI